MAQTLLFKELPVLKLTETNASWMVVNQVKPGIHSWGIKMSKEQGHTKKDFEEAAMKDHNALEVEWVKWDGVSY